MACIVFLAISSAALIGVGWRGGYSSLFFPTKTGTVRFCPLSILGRCSSFVDWIWYFHAIEHVACILVRPSFKIPYLYVGLFCPPVDDGVKHRWELPGNYSFNIYIHIYGNLPFRLDNHVWFLLPPKFTTILYSYPLINILYLGEPPGHSIRNYHDTFIYIFMHGYYYICQMKFIKLFSVNVTVLFEDVSTFLMKLLLKLFHFLVAQKFLRLITLKFPSCCISQVHLLQNLICFSINNHMCSNRNYFYFI